MILDNGKYWFSNIICLPRPKRFALKSYKRLYFVCKNLYLLAYKNADSARKSGELLFSVQLKGCEVTPALNLTANKFEVKLEVPSAEGMTEMFLKFNSVSDIEIDIMFYIITH